MNEDPISKSYYFERIKKKQKYQPSSTLKYNLAHYFVLLSARSVATAILHPFSLTTTWRIVGGDNYNSWFECFKSVKNNTIKSLYDGVVVTLVGSMCQNILIDGCMALLRPLLAIPDDQELQDKFFTLFKLEASHNEMKKSFRALMRNTVNYKLSKFLTTSILYPLYTLKYRMEAQGCTYLMPYFSSSIMDNINKILDEEGYEGFYKGFEAHLISIVPEMGAVLFWYFIVSLLIAFLYPEDDSDDNDYQFDDDSDDDVVDDNEDDSDDDIVVNTDTDFSDDDDVVDELSQNDYAHDSDPDYSDDEFD
eukprot:TRINITY_DN1990_c0_g2_i1.p1 TRINITY_DN1990_c0_g2~~TRINITY_DN1990_c0_g2_i1.p1  ORF type:complete len:307 (-),score=110.71 TRINITY_DN1990_c0_g2_i1:121-1041(-)